MGTHLKSSKLENGFKVDIIWTKKNHRDEEVVWKNLTFIWELDFLCGIESKRYIIFAS